jgi:hypothetical protein
LRPQKAHRLRQRIGPDVGEGGMNCGSKRRLGFGPLLQVVRVGLESRPHLAPGEPFGAQSSRPLEQRIDVRRRRVADGEHGKLALPTCYLDGETTPEPRAE